jgi:glucose/arabinose dehydrogenase
MTFLPNGDLLVTERPGRLRLVTDKGLHPKPIAGVPAVYARRQGGMLDVAVHPEFSENRLVYLSYSSGTGKDNATAIARAKLGDHALEDLEVIFTVTPGKSNGFHYGSRLVFLPDGSLTFSVGDGGMRDFAQEVGSYYGKVLRILPDGEHATDNPFQARVDAQQEVYSYGHRNIQGMALHPETGELWATEHGPKGGDELNLIRPGANYGWPRFTYGEEYRGGPIGAGMEHVDGTTAPVAVWTPSIATSGLAWYTGDAMPQWTGSLFAGGLVLRQIRRLTIEDGAVTHQETLHFDERVRDVRNGPDGHLYVATDSRSGRILRIVAAD